jgi:hypothetical protein
MTNICAINDEGNREVLLIGSALKAAKIYFEENGDTSSVFSNALKIVDSVGFFTSGLLKNNNLEEPAVTNIHAIHVDGVHELMLIGSALKTAKIYIEENGDTYPEVSDALDIVEKIVDEGFASI